jgi:hypothetical protein
MLGRQSLQMDLGDAVHWTRKKQPKSQPDDGREEKTYY